jgi:cytochrome c553
MFLMLLACAAKTPAVGDAPAVAEPVVAEPAVSEPAVSEPAAAEPAEETLAFHMSEHYAKTLVARDSFIHGEIGAAREALAWIGEHPEPEGMPEGAGPFLTQMRQAAEAGAQATHPDGTAKGIADLGAACGSCHAAFSVSPGIEVGQAPPPSTELLPHMMRHQWAVGAMWVGLVGPSDAAWQQGTAAMSEAALPEGAYEVPQVSEGAWKHAETAHSAAASQEPDRSQTYATVVGSCAGCHSEMRGE